MPTFTPRNNGVTWLRGMPRPAPIPLPRSSSFPKNFLDVGCYDVNGERKGCGVAETHTSFSTMDGENVLWHPDRKVFLLGKVVTDKLLDDLTVLEKGA